MAKRDMLINYVPGEECRIAIVEDGSLEEFYQERSDAGSHVGNIYAGKVQNVEASIQAAFVDFGLERNGFLHISDLHPMYFPGKDREESERVGMRTPRRERPPIQRCLRRGQEIFVQVLKEGIGTKGPTLTSYLSIPGRFLVMMPFMQRLGVSRKVEDDDRRRAMRKILDELNPPDDFGFIIRTAGMERTKTELKRDLAYLQRLWKAIERRRKETKVGELYTESDLIIRTIRDVYSSDIERIIVDEAEAAERASDFLAVASPRAGANVLHYHDPVPIFERYGIEQQIDSIGAAEVALPSGGSLVIEPTEALVAIDVNSGKMRDNRDAETTAYRTNIEACDEICRQLRLRDLGGVVVNDLIDMRDPKHRRALESRFRDNLKKDRARTRVLPISQFGILEMTRQRMRPSLQSAQSSGCPHCAGSGKVKSPQLVVLDVVRRLATVLYRDDVSEVELVVSPDVAFQLLNRRRAQLVRLEREYGKTVMVRVRQGGRLDAVEIEARDDRGGRIDLESATKWAEPKLEPVGKKSSDRGRDADPDAESNDEHELSTDDADVSETTETAGGEAKTGGRRRRRRRRSGARRSSANGDAAHTDANHGDAPQGDPGIDSVVAKEADQSARSNGSGSAAPASNSNTDSNSDGDTGEAKPKRRRSRRRRGGKSKASASGSGTSDDATEASDAGADHGDGDREHQSAAKQATKEHGTTTQDSGQGTDEQAPKKKRRRRRSRSGAAKAAAGDDAGGPARDQAPSSATPTSMPSTPSGGADGKSGSGASDNASKEKRGSGYSNPRLEPTSS